MLLTSVEVCNRIMERLTWKKEKANVKYIIKEYEKGITYSKEVMSQYEGVNIHRNESLKKMEYRNCTINLNCNFYFWILPIFYYQH